MNCYATLSKVKTALGLSDVTTHNATLLWLLESTSRYIDELCCRHFYTTDATRYFNTRGASRELWIDDCLGITSLKCDDDLDLTYGEEWTENTDFALSPANTWPKMRVWTLPEGSYRFTINKERQVEIAGTFGFGDGKNATPWAASAITGTGHSTGSTLTLSAEGTIEAGQTILVESEQMFVSAVTSDDSDEATVERGVNGTTAASHSAKAITVATYPEGVEKFAVHKTCEAWNRSGRESFESEREGDYYYKIRPDAASFDTNALAAFMR